MGTWYLGLAHLPIYLVLIPFAALFLYAAWNGAYSRKSFSGQWKWVLIFMIFFLSILAVRFVNPSISYAEKFMDHAFLASIMRVPVIPPLDPWFLGGYLDVYYYLGYWLFGSFALVSGVPSNIAFNLALPTVFGLSAILLYALGWLLTDRFSWLPLATLLVVNPSFVWHLLQGKALGSILWDSTRTIPDTINEYPVFSFLWGDVHPHVIGIFNQVFFLFLLVFAWKRWSDAAPAERWVIMLLSGLSLGSMPLINTWDVIVYAPVTILFGLMLWYGCDPGKPGTQSAGNLALLRHSCRRILAGARGFLADRSWRRSFFSVLRPSRITDASFSYLVLVPVMAVLCYLPFYLTMNTRGIQGVGWVFLPTSPADFLLVHGLFLALMILYLAGDIRRKPWYLLVPLPLVLAGYPAAAIAAVPLVYLLARRTRTPAEVLAILGLFIVIACEFLYLMDNMGETYFRMNTVFKFYIAAWLLMGSSSFAMLASMAGRFIAPGTVPRAVSRAALVIVSLLLVITPLVLPLDTPYRGATLDGLAYLESAYPGDAAAVAFLRSIPGNPGLVEAEGGDYTYYSRISSFTGISSVIGWTFHEFMWRDDSDGWYGRRLADVRTIYEQPDRTAALMRSYNATFLYVGDLEREKYDVRVRETGLPLVYDDAGVQIYSLPEWVQNR